MCDACAKVYGNLPIHHGPNGCPVKLAAYCGHCGTRGHFTKDCKTHRGIQKIVPKIASQIGEETVPVIVLMKEERTVSAFLRFYKQSDCKQLSKNVATVKKFCKERKLKLRWIELPNDIPE